MEEKDKNNSNLPIKKEVILTDKQKAFVKKYVRSGGQGTESYMSVYKVFKKGVASASVTRLLKTESIKLAIEEEILNLKNLERVDRFYIVEKLKNMAERAEAEGNDKYLIESLDMLCKMEGYYQQAKTPGQTIVKGNVNVLFGDFDPQSGKVLPPSAINPLESPAFDADIQDVDYEETEDDELF